MTTQAKIHNRLLRFAALLLFCTVPAVAHAEFIDYIGNLLVEAFFILCALIGIPILLYQLLRRPTPRKPDEQWPPKESAAQLL